MIVINNIDFYLDKSKSTSPGAEEGNSPRGTFGIPDVWRKYRVDSNKVNEWTANLRMVHFFNITVIRFKINILLIYFLEIILVD